MPVTSSGVTVGTTITKVSSADSATKLVYLQSGTAGAVTYVGGSDVSAANGILLSETNVTVFQSYQDDAFYAISDTADAVVKVLEVK